MPTNCRPDAVDALVHAAMNGMTPVAMHASADEVISACLTMALRAVQICPNKEVCREGIEKLWSLLPEVKVM